MRISCRAAGLVLSLFASGGCAAADDGTEDCSVVAQNRYVHALMRDIYLWSDRVPALDPASYPSPQAVLEAMAFRELDRWSGIQSALRRERLMEDGSYLGLGVQFVMDAEDRLRVAFVHADSPAGQAGLSRGTTVLAINGTSIEQIVAEDSWGSIDGPEELGVEVSYSVEDEPSGQRELRLVKDWVRIQTVADSRVIEHGERNIGYLLFTGFLGTSPGELRPAFRELKQAGVNELVLDLRYNGGGLLSTAAVLASLIAGPEHADELFVTLSYNEEHERRNRGIALVEEDNALGATRVLALTGPGTASASELVLNGLAPYTQVELVGATTHGKPVGSNTWTHCGNAISPITFRTLNAENNGDYFDGLPVACEASDDLDHPLGDPGEARLAAALTLLTSGRCDETLALELPEDGVPGARAPRRVGRERIIRRGPADSFGWF